MLIVVAETVSRTAIGVLFFLICKVSVISVFKFSVFRAGVLSDSISTHLKP